MIDTEDLNNYLPGYDEYLEEQEKQMIIDNYLDAMADEYHEQKMIERGAEECE